MERQRDLRGWPNDEFAPYRPKSSLPLCRVGSKAESVGCACVVARAKARATAAVVGGLTVDGTSAVAYDVVEVGVGGAVGGPVVSGCV